MGAIDVGSFRNAAQIVGDNGQVSFDADKGAICSSVPAKGALGEFEVALSAADKQRNCEVRGLLLNALAQDIGAERMASARMKAFFETVVTRLLGDGSVDGDAVCFKPLSARDVRQILDQTAFMKIVATNDAFESENGALIKLAAANLAELEQLKGQPHVDDDAVDGAIRVFEDAKRQIYQDIENGGKSGVNELKAAYEKFTVATGNIRTRAQIGTFEPQFKAAIEDFSTKWQTQVGNGSKALEDCAASVKEKFTALADRFLNEMRGIAFNGSPTPAELKGVQANHLADFEAKLSHIRNEGERLLGQAKANAPLVARNADRLAGEMESLNETLLNLLDGITDTDARFAYVDWFDATMDGLKGTVSRQLTENGVVSPGTIQDAARQIRAFTERVAAKFDAFTGSLDSLQGILGVLTPPSVRITSVDQELSEQRLMAFGVTAGIGPELAQLDSTAANDIKAQFKQFNDTAKTLFGDFQAVGDVDAARAFESAVKAESAKIEQAVVAAFKAGVDLSDGVAALFDAALGKLSSMHRQFVASHVETAFAKSADESLAMIREAAAKATNPKEKAMLGAGADALRALIDDRKAQLVRHQADGKEVSPSSARAVAAEIGELVSTFVADVRTAASENAGLKFVKNLVGERRGDPQLGQPTASFQIRGAFVNPFAGMNGGAFESVDALNAATEREVAFQKMYGGAMDGVNKQITALVETAMLAHIGSEKFVERNENGDFNGLNEAGAQLLDNTVTEATGKVVAHLRGLPPSDEPVSAADVMSLVSGMVKTAVDARLNLSMVEEEVEEVRQESIYPKGVNLFGVDLAKLTPEQKSGLGKIADMLLVDSVRRRIAAGEMTIEDVLAQRTGGSTLEMTSPMVERSLWKGDIDLANVSGRMRLVINLMLKGMFAGQQSETQGGFGTTDMSKILSALTDSGLPLEVLDAVEDDDIERVNLFLGALYALNNFKGEGMDAMCLRVFGTTMRDVIEHGLHADQANAIRTRVENKEDVSAHELIQLKLYTDIQHLTNYETEGEAHWRSHFDPLAMATAPEARAVAFVMRQCVPTAAEKSDILKIRTALAGLAPGQSATVSFGGVPITFRRDQGNGISADVMMVRSELALDKDGGVIVKHGGSATRRPVAVAVPADVKAFLDQLDDTIVGDVATYGATAAKDVLDKQIAADLDAQRNAGDAQRDAGGANPKPSSSRSRQLAMNVLSSAAGLRTADLSQLPTAKIVELAQRVLSLPGFDDLEPGQRAEAVADGLKTDGAVLLNAEGTLELYEKMVNATQEMKRKVFVPDPPKVRKGETPAQARIRQLHEFAADLLQPHDTTGYDLDRRSGLSDIAIMRKSLLAHRAEVQMLLRDPGLIATFDLPGDKGVKLTGFKTALQTLSSQLTELFGKSASMDEFFGRIEHGEADGFLETAQKGLAKAADAALANLQGAFADKLNQAFRENMGSANEPMWKKSLDELANSSKINVQAGYGKFLMSVIGEYFSSMDPIDRSRMASLVMRFSNSESTIGDALGALLKGAGPILQKLMQGLPQSTLPADLQQAVADLKCNLAPIPEDAVRAYLLDMVAESGGRIEGITVTRSLGAASVGQAFLCRVKTPEHPEGEECVVKILRPDVQSRAKREEAFFNGKAKELGLGGMLKERFDRIFEELDLVVESRNVNEGSVYDPGATLYSDPDVASMKLYSKVNSTMNTLVLKKAPGDTFDNYTADIGKRTDATLSNARKVVNEDGSVKYVTTSFAEYVVARQRLSALYGEVSKRQETLVKFISAWTYEAVFGKGFFHGDLHAGNIMTSDLGLTVIDYGNVSHFSPKDQKELMCILAHVTAKNPEAFLDHFAKLIPASGKADFKRLRASLQTDLAEIFSKSTNDDSGKMFVAALQLMQNTGVEIPGSLFNLMQSMQRLDESVNQLNAQLAEISSAIETLEVVRPDEGARPIHYVDKFLMAGADSPELRTQLSSGSFRIAKDAASSIFSCINTEQNTAQIKADVLAACKQGPDALNGMLDDLLAMFDGIDVHGQPIDMVLKEVIVGIDPTVFFAEGSDELQERFARRIAEEVVGSIISLREVAGTTAENQAGMKTPKSFARALGIAVLKGKDKLTANFGFGNLRESANLRSNMKRETFITEVTNARLNGSEPDEDDPGAPVKGAKQRLAEFAADPDSGLFVREVTLAGEAGTNFVLSKQVLDSFAKKDWASDPGKRQLVFEALTFNLGKLKQHMEQKGLGPRMAADPTLMRKYAKAAAIGFFARHASLEKSLIALSDQEFDALRTAAGDNADLVAFLDALRAQPPINVDEKAIQKDVDEEFAIFG